MENLQVLLKDGDYLCFDDIIASSRRSVSQGAVQKKSARKNKKKRGEEKPFLFFRAQFSA